MNFPIIVESIENAKQLGAVRQCGCTEGQGFYFCRPVPVEEFEQNMRQPSIGEQIVKQTAESEQNAQQPTGSEQA